MAISYPAKKSSASSSDMPACPTCRTSIPLEDINVANDVALCRGCRQNFSYAELIGAGGATNEVNLNTPPGGAWFTRTTRGFEVGASTRSAFALIMVPFMCVWSGGSLGGIYGKQIVDGKLNIGMSLFGIPFLLGTVVLGSVAVMMVCGKVVVRVEGDDASIFTGAGPIGWTRRFSWADISSVRTSEKRSGRGASSEQITLEGQRRIDLASGLNSERRHFMVAALRRMRREHR